MGDGSDIDVEVAAPPTVSLRRWLLVLMLLSFNLIDVALTRAVLSFGGREANPLMEPIVDDVGLTLMLKVIVCLGVGALLMYSPPSSRFAERAVAVVLFFYVVVAGWNIGILISQIPQA